MKTTFLIATTLLATAGIASADESAADALKRGHAAYKAGRIHEACDAYAASDKLAPSADTEMSLAGCYEQDGKPVAAAKLYRGVAAKDAGKTSAAAKAAKLEARAPKLRFAVNQVPGLKIMVDGVEVSPTEDVMVDTGPHEVIATAPGFTGHTSAPVDREKAIVDVIIRLEPTREPAPAAAPAPAPMAAAPAAAPMVAPAQPLPDMRDEPGSPDHRKRNGIIVGAVGVAALATAGVMFAVSSSKFDDEHALCPSSQCANTDDLAKAHSLLDDGHTYRGLSIGMGIGGVVLAAAGVYLLVTPHHEESHMTVQLDHAGGSIGYTARF
ncbi:MAG TPA: hypothetical protein VFQ65_09475 [Kofleriaceae bacterium]|nr:hypothetical protein [Kofleriaceae bacterium]